MLAYEPDQRYQNIAELLPELKSVARQSGLVMDESLVHVLVVEDGNGELQITKRLLERSNRSLDVCHAPDLASACDAIWMHTESTALPLIVLFDLNLPDSEPAKTLRKISQLADDQVHLVALVDVDDSRLREDAMNMGVAEFLSKEKLTDQLIERTIFATFGRIPTPLRVTRDDT